MTDICYVSHQTEFKRMLSVFDDGAVKEISALSDRETFVALDGCLTRAFSLSFPKRIRKVLPAVQFTLETSLSSSLSDQVFFLRQRHWAKQADGFCVLQEHLDSIKAQLDELSLPLQLVYPDYLFLPWDSACVTIAHEGEWCRLRYGEYLGCKVSLSSLPAIIQALANDTDIERACVFSLDDSVDWQQFLDLPCDSIKRIAPWCVDTLPNSLHAQLSLPFKQAVVQSRSKALKVLSSWQLTVGLLFVLTALIAQLVLA